MNNTLNADDAIQWCIPGTLISDIDGTIDNWNWTYYTDTEYHAAWEQKLKVTRIEISEVSPIIDSSVVQNEPYSLCHFISKHTIICKLIK